MPSRIARKRSNISIKNRTMNVFWVVDKESRGQIFEICMSKIQNSLDSNLRFFFKVADHEFYFVEFIKLKLSDKYFGSLKQGKLLDYSFISKHNSVISESLPPFFFSFLLSIRRLYSIFSVG